jgi:hypothetical protein
MARRSAKQDRVAVPKALTAIRADERQFFVEARGVRGVYAKACCAFEAKADYINRLIEAKAKVLA